MACKNICKLCDRLIISTYVVFDAATNSLVVGLPANSYADGEKYCIVIAQTIPAATTINASVVVTIGTDATTYPVLNCDCIPLTANGVRTRTKYSTKVVTTATGGSFKLLGKVCCNTDTLAAIGSTIQKGERNEITLQT